MWYATCHWEWQSQLNRTKTLFSFFTCDDKLIISFRNQGTQVRDKIVRTAKNAINTTNLANGLSVWLLNLSFKLDVLNILKKAKAGAFTVLRRPRCKKEKRSNLRFSHGYYTLHNTRSSTKNWKHGKQQSHSTVLEIKFSRFLKNIKHYRQAMK